MHLKIFFKSNTEVRMPVHYNRIVQGMIYNNISKELADFLHDKGFPYEKRSFKMFTFSRIMGRSYLDRKNNQFVFPEGFNLTIASPLEPFCVEIGNILMFSDKVDFSHNSMQVEKVEVLKPEVTEGSVEFKVMSPVVTYSTFIKPEGGKYTCYYQPGEKEFEQQIGANLRKKYVSLYQKEPPAGEVKVLKHGKPRQNIVKYKDFTVKGYTCYLSMSGPRELLQMALDTGLGSKNCQGFGCVSLRS
ncbi:CRISPR-associated endoribonuclease Cas6 [Candidatus Contubernalis alkaliaceticus]|uniref:CRISPR-associated endoribonuclease Cas6 n=1 Tax=Candidatus Contubernalis alkaliaceticus TaxID=338645 RepID=UPI001F4C3FB5|nr:CRISPR-associated endoribonuclease Cas6 [Candidatus Contubernalis alkalaceticus]UNC93176.1 CRISPR-associated endoribonuclease Cas6 [Candidatus Contubernalis alkalaceticus]